MTSDTIEPIETVAVEACACIDVDGDARPSPELLAAIGKLNESQRNLLATAIALFRTHTSRNRAMPAEVFVGNDIFRVLGRLGSGPPGAADILDAALRKVDPTWEPILDAPVTWPA